MAVDSKHSQYTARFEDWKVLRDVVAGQRAVHKAGVAYLPKLSEQTEAEYAAYVKRALFYNATARTLDGLTGMIFRRPAVVEMPAGMRDEFTADCTLDGQPFGAFAEGVVEEVVALGRCGILVDFSGAVEGPESVAQARAAGKRPYWRMYRAESILNWATGQVRGATALVSVTLEETAEVEGETVLQLRVLKLVEGSYVVEVWRKPKVAGNTADTWVLTSTTVPQMNGAALPYIPFVFAGPRDQRPQVSKPPLLDLADANVKHYQLAADYYHGVHFTGLPTAVVTGHSLEKDADGNTQVLRIGSTAAWVFPSPDADAKYLEFAGEGLGEAGKAMDRVETQMAYLGARMLAPEKASAEAAETVALRRQGEASALSSLAIAVSMALTRALEIARDWYAMSGEVSVELNHDFDEAGLSPQEMAGLVDAWQKGAISKSVLRWNLRMGEVIPTEVTDEQMDEELEQDPPSLGLIGLGAFDPRSPTGANGE